MSILSKFLTGSLVKKIMSVAVKVLKLIGVQVANDLMTIAREEVTRAQLSGKSSADKYEMVMAALKKRLPAVGEHAANLAIELALAAIKAR